VQSFPDHGKYLEKVAQQRLETTNLDDLDLDYEMTASSDEDSSDPDSSTTVQVKTSYLAQNWYNTGSVGCAPRVLEPTGRLFLIWSALVFCAFGYNLFYVSFAIAFDYQIEDGFYVLDAL
jgi:hypothetical protein